MSSLSLALLLLAPCYVLTATPKAFASDAPPPVASPTSPCMSHPIVSTPQVIRLHGRELHYLSHAGFLPIRDAATGHVHGCIFFVAYIVAAGSRAPGRPITFLWNGGPGANSAPLHFEAFGPMQIPMSPSPTQVNPSPRRLVDNSATLLDQSDLVFVDPVGTGFSRPSKPSYGTEFYGVSGDIRSIAEFIRVYRIRFNAWDAPIFLAGESYGVWRAAGVADNLLQKGFPVKGLILLSGGIPVGQSLPVLLRLALFLPNMTAAAFYYKKLPATLETSLPAALRAAGDWAQNTYAPALLDTNHLSPAQRAAITRKLSQFSGIPADAIKANTLVIGRHQFATELLGVPGKELTMLDSRLSAPRPGDARQVELIVRYLHQQLGVPGAVPYLGLGHGDPGESGYDPASGPLPASINENWHYDQAGTASDASSAGALPAANPTMAAAERYVDYGPPGGHPPWLNRDLALNPRLRVFVGTGRFDTLNSCLGERVLVRHLPHALRQNISVHCYDSGHMIYLDEKARVALRADLGDFYAQALEATR